MLILTGEAAVDERFDLTRVRRILLISADGQAANDASTAQKKHLSGLGQIFSAVSGTQIDSYNFETMMLAGGARGFARHHSQAALRKRPGRADGHLCGDVESTFVHLSLAGIADQTERARLQQIPTGLTIDPADTALLVAAGEEAGEELRGSRILP